MLNTQKWPTYAPIVLRLGLTAVFTWFGVSQLVNTAQWVGLVPTWATGIFSLSAVDIVHINGVFELICALMLGTGFYVRWAAALLALHLFVITSHLGITSIGVRDFGLSFATLALALFGEDTLCAQYEGPAETSGS